MNLPRIHYLAMMARCLVSAVHCHRVAMTGQVDFKTKTEDRQWYRDARKGHMQNARRYKALWLGETV